MPAPFAMMNGTQPWEILTYCNTITEGWFGNGMILLIWLVIFLAFGVNYPKNRAFAAATFLIAPLALIFLFLGIITFNIIIIVITMILLSLIFLGGTDKS